MSASQKVLIVLASKHCATLKELQESTGLSEKTLLVVLSKLKRKGLITSRWIYVEDKRRRRLYCLEVRV